MIGSIIQCGRLLALVVLVISLYVPHFQTQFKYLVLFGLLQLNSRHENMTLPLLEPHSYTDRSKLFAISTKTVLVPIFVPGLIENALQSVTARLAKASFVRASLV